MPSVTFNPSSQDFAGDVAAGFIVKHLFTSETVRQRAIYVDDTVTFKRKVRRITAANVLQAYKSRPVASDSKADLTISYRELEPKSVMIYKELEPNDFQNDWLAIEQSGMELLDLRLPATAESYIIQEILRAAAKDLDRAIWSNNPAAAGNPIQWGGITQELTAAGSGVLRVASAVVLTVANIIAKMGDTYDALPAEVRRDSMCKFLVNHKTAELYRKALVALTNKSIDPTAGPVFNFAGIPIVVLPGIPDDCIIMAITGDTRDSNFWLGAQTKGSTPQDQPAVKFMPLSNNSEDWFVKAIYKADVMVGWPDEVALYLPA